MPLCPWTPVAVSPVGWASSPTVRHARRSIPGAGVEIYGAAKGLGPQTMHEVYGQVVTWAQSGELTFDVVKVQLSDIEIAWQRTDLRGTRLVIVP